MLPRQIIDNNVKLALKASLGGLTISTIGLVVISILKITVHPTNEYLSIERVSLNKKALRFIDNQALEFLYFQ